MIGDLDFTSGGFDGIDRKQGLVDRRLCAVKHRALENRAATLEKRVDEAKDDMEKKIKEAAESMRETNKERKEIEKALFDRVERIENNLLKVFFGVGLTLIGVVANIAVTFGLNGGG